MTLRQKLISFFIIFNIVAILFMPVRRYPLPKTFRKVIAYYTLFTRTHQEWALFSPEPRRDASYYQVQVYYSDHSTYMWRRPYPDNWSFFYRHLCYAWQKYDLAITHMEDPRYWDDIVNFISHQDFNKKPIAKIRLSKMRAWWPPPKPEGFVFSDVNDLKWNDLTLFVYDNEQKRFL